MWVHLHFCAKCGQKTQTNITYRFTRISISTSIPLKNKKKETVNIKKKSKNKCPSNKTVTVVLQLFSNLVHTSNF